MKRNKIKSNPKLAPLVDQLQNILPGYPIYPEGEDIYNTDRKETEIDPEDISNTKKRDEKTGKRNEKDFEDDMSGDDLDIPGAELDDNQENIGSEDEENNYYSLGSDSHADLDENRDK